MKASTVWLVTVMTVACWSGKSVADGGDRWSLSDDFQVISNPSPPVDPGAPGGGTGTWTYFHGNGDYTTTTVLPAGANPELPDEGFGWVNPEANHIGLFKFTVDSRPSGIPPAADYNEAGGVDAADYTVWRDNLGAANSLPNDDSAGVGDDDYDRWKTNFGNMAGNDTTNFGVGEIGGHGTTGARWTTDHAGEFLVEWLGYNGRNQIVGPPGRLTFLRMTGPDGADLDVTAIFGGVQDGLANAYMSSATMALNAGDTLTLTNEGGDWVGIDLTITELPITPSATGVTASLQATAVPEPRAWVLAAFACITAVGLRLRRLNPT